MPGIDKIIDDLYGLLKTRWWGWPLIGLGIIAIVLFTLWDSLPTSSKERILGQPQQQPQSVSTAAPATVVGPIWVEEGKPLQIFNDQVQVTIHWARPSVQTVVVDLELPSGPANWGVTTTGTTRTFGFSGHTYFFRVIEVSDGKAKIMITKKV